VTEFGSSQGRPSHARAGPKAATGAVMLSDLIQQRLQDQLGSRIRDLRVLIEPGGLVISGRSRTYYDKQMAQHIVRQASGLRIADNRIEVDASVTPASSPPHG
jgi:hypothetical protein